jgi:hypothetical protein
MEAISFLKHQSVPTRLHGTVSENTNIFKEGTSLNVFGIIKLFFVLVLSNNLRLKNQYISKDGSSFIFR